MPDTKTIFLTRPTISKTLMTQMIGRGLRGERAGGTKEAYIVSFIDNWDDNIAWVNPKTIIEEEVLLPEDDERKTRERNVRYISIKKIEEFARILDESIDTSHIESINYIERVPIGMYNFAYIENEVDINCQILIYNSNKPYYDDLIEDLPSIFKDLDIKEEHIEDKLLNKLVNYIEKTYFHAYIVPGYNKKDLEDLLKYYAQKGIVPSFYELDYIDRQKLDMSLLAEKIIKDDMGPRKQAKYLKSIWYDEDTLVRIYFNKFTYFINQVEKEIGNIIYREDKIGGITIDYPKKSKEELPLSAWDKYWPEEAKKMRNLIYNKNKLQNGNYVCMDCDLESDNRRPFHIDHIKPMSKGGLTVEENLQILCRRCNMIKSDIYDG